MGNAPTFLLAIDMNLSQFQDCVCQNAFAYGAPPRTPLGGLHRPPDPQLQSFGSRQNEPPPFRNHGYGPGSPVYIFRACMAVVLRRHGGDGGATAGARR